MFNTFYFQMREIPDLQVYSPNKQNFKFLHFIWRDQAV